MEMGLRMVSGEMEEAVGTREWVVEENSGLEELGMGVLVEELDLSEGRW